MEEEIKSYIKRGISDIARKCHVYDDEVVKIIKQMLAIWVEHVVELKRLLR
jgi:hypothetical protein